MLDSIGEVKAFKILSDAGISTPESITISRAASVKASSLASAIQGIVHADKTYPDSVSAWTTQLLGFSEQLNEASKASSLLADSLSPYTKPSELLQMKIGWECYAKGNELTPIPAFALVEGMGNVSIPQSLTDALTALKLDALKTAMNAINAKVEAAGSAGGDSNGGQGGTGGAQAPVITQDEIDALREAVTAAEVLLSEINSASESVVALAGRIKTSTTQATKGLENAVAITLTGSLLDDAVMSPAISLIMPQGVIDALQTNTKKGTIATPLRNTKGCKLVHV
ncbi:hypothetical protein E5S23_004888 [Escherichia coli]|nr:hypothetical protein [Escherichia coli]EEU0690417.1 hypothetical protein [Escherichia coli]EEU4315162.1 hypothetical protein [Escherichia coli]